MRVNVRGNVSNKIWPGLLGLWLGSGCVIVDGSDDDGGDTNATTNASADDSDDQGSADDTSDDGSVPMPEVPDNEYCAGVLAWAQPYSLFEEQVVELVNMERAVGATCGNQTFGSAGPLVMNPALRCSSRVHSLDMAERNFFSHDNPDGQDPFVRMELAGYTYSAAGENIAAGQTTPEEVVDGWMDSPGHCSNIMDPDFTEIGVGYTQSTTAEYPHYWTQNFGAPG